jgi:hypothetical protein
MRKIIEITTGIITEYPDTCSCTCGCGHVLDNNEMDDRGDWCHACYGGKGHSPTRRNGVPV